MSLFVNQQNLPFQAVSPFLRYMAPGADIAPAEWASKQCHDIREGDIVFVLEPIYSPWSDSSSGIGVAEGDKFKVSQAIFICKKDGKRLLALALTSDIYEQQILEPFLAQQANIAKENGSGLYYAVGRYKEVLAPEVVQRLTGLNRYGKSGWRTDDSKLIDLPYAFLQALGFQADVAPGVLLDLNILAYMIICEKDSPAGTKIPDLRGSYSAIRASEGGSDSSGVAESAGAPEPAASYEVASEAAAPIVPPPAKGALAGLVPPRAPAQSEPAVHVPPPPVSAPAPPLHASPAPHESEAITELLPPLTEEDVAAMKASYDAGEVPAIHGAVPPPLSAATASGPSGQSSAAPPEAGEASAAGSIQSESPAAQTSQPVESSLDAALEEIIATEPAAGSTAQARADAGAPSEPDSDGGLQSVQSVVDTSADSGSPADSGVPSEPAGGAPPKIPFSQPSRQQSLRRTGQGKIPIPINAPGQKVPPLPSQGVPPAPAVRSPGQAPTPEVTAAAASSATSPQSTAQPVAQIDAPAPGPVEKIQSTFAPTESKSQLADLSQVIAGLVSDSQAEDDDMSLQAAPPNLTAPPPKKKKVEPPDTKRAQELAARAPLKEAVTVRSGVAGLVSKLEQQASKAASRLEQQVDETQTRLASELSRLIDSVNSDERKGIKTAESVRINFAAKMEAAAAEVRATVRGSAETGSSTINEYIDTAKTNLDDKHDYLRTSLKETFDDVRIKAETLSRAFEQNADSLCDQHLSELRELAEEVTARFSELSDYYLQEIQQSADHFMSRAGQRASAATDALQQLFTTLNGELSDEHARAQRKIEDYAKNLEKRAEQLLSSAQTSISETQSEALSTTVLPKLKEYRETLRALAVEFQQKLSIDVEARGEAKIAEFEPTVQDKKQQLSALLADATKIKDVVEKRQKEQFDAIHKDLTSFVEKSVDEAKSFFKSTEEQIAEIDRAVRVLADPSSIESDMELLEERNTALDKLEEVGSRNTEEVTNAVRTNVAMLEERAKVLQEELLSSMEEDAYLVRRASEQSLVKIREAIKETFSAIQQAQDEQME